MMIVDAYNMAAKNYPSTERAEDDQNSDSSGSLHTEYSSESEK